MRVPLTWLREYVDFDLTASEFVDLFTLRSQEVEGVYRLGLLDGEVVVGEVVDFGPHPNADRLSVARVDLGGQVVQIVAGASNPYTGARVPVVLPGSVMSDGTQLEKANLRGLESHGMMMSERELGISNDHDGILILQGDFEVGRPLADYLPVSETVIDISVTPNRPDLWGMIGVARELAAILRVGFRIPEPSFQVDGKPASDFGLRVEAPELCPRYDLRRVSGVTPGRTAPLEMRRRVFAAGMRPISAIVDATNYAMLETGQPIHAFDASEVRGGIVVRRARPDERITMLDGSTRTLDEAMVVIADEERGLAIGGVMGAEDAEVGVETRDVLIEVATFVGRNILETSQRLGLRTDSSSRFERGLDPNMVQYAMDRVTQLLTRNTGGQSSPDTLSEYPEPVEPWRVPMRLQRARAVLGMPVDAEEAAARLESLGCEVESEDGFLSALVPTFRRDLRREADLIEEVGRLVGLEKVPEDLPGVSQPGGLTETQRRVRVLRHLLADLGLTEAVTYPFGPERWTADLRLDRGEASVVAIRNPLSTEGSSLRGMILPGLLDAAARNRAFGARGLGLFEVGTVFEGEPLGADLREAAIEFRLTGVVENEVDAWRLMGVSEKTRVGVLLAGTVLPAGWNHPDRDAGFFEAKGVVERIVPSASFEPTEIPFLHPGRSAAVLVDGGEAGWVGELHPEVRERFDLGAWPVAALELAVELCDPDPAPRFEPYVNVPAVNRDLAVVVPSRVPVGTMLAAIYEVRGPILADVRVFDVYEGRQVQQGHKSVALSLTFQADKTLTDEAATAEVQRIAARLEEVFGARIRG